MTNVIDVQEYKTRYHKRILSAYVGNINELSFIALRFYFNKCGHELVELYNQKDNNVRYGLTENLPISYTNLFVDARAYAKPKLFFKYAEEDLELSQKIDELNLIYNSIKNKYKEKTNE